MPGTPATTKITEFTANFTDIGGAGYGPGARVTKGEFLLECIDAEVKIKRGDENKPSARQSKMVAFVWRIMGGNGRGVIYENANIVLFDEKGVKRDPKKYLWVLRQRMNDMFSGDREFEQKAYKIDLVKCIGRRIGASLDDGAPYTRPGTDGKPPVTTIRSEIQGSYPAAEWERLYSSTDNPNAVDASADADADEADDETEDAAVETAANAEVTTPDADAEAANPGSDDDLDDIEVEDM